MHCGGDALDKECIPEILCLTDVNWISTLRQFIGFRHFTCLLSSSAEVKSSPLSSATIVGMFRIYIRIQVNESIK